MNRSGREAGPEHPHISACRLSKMTFWWLKGLFKMGMKATITEQDIYNNLDEHNSKPISDMFSSLWEDELKRNSPSVLRMFYRAYGFGVISIGLLFSINETIMRCIQPLFLGAMISYFVGEKDNVSKSEAYYYAAGIAVCSLIPVITFHPFILYIIETGMKIKLGCQALVYKKILKLSKSAAIDGLSGRVINLMSNDIGKFDMAMCFIHDLWKGPLEALLLGYLIYRQIGFAGIIGMAFIFSFIPIQSWIGKKSAQFRMKTTKRTDIRVKFMNEIINGMQIIKMYTWENSFAKMIEKTRTKEMKAVKGSTYILALLLAFWAVSRVSIFLSLVTYVYYGNVITAQKVFIVSSYFSILNESMVHFWPLSITFCAEGYISSRRLKEFLLLDEHKPRAINKDQDFGKVHSNGVISQDMQIFKKSEKMSGEEDEKTGLLPSKIVNINSGKPGIVLDNVTAAWVNSSGEANTGIDKMNLKVEAGELCALIGAVGSGKTSVLQAILGELEIDSGALQVDGVISYANQEAWLYGGSIKSNILFVDEYDERRYRQVVKVCALEKDFEQLIHGDDTIVGERGISLSGGQKARINLARCVYKKADIYLLDDPLSAVDTHVGKHIFKQCIQDYLRDKIVILITHQLQYLTKVQHVVLIADGAIEAQGSYAKLKESNLDIMLNLSPEEVTTPEVALEKENLRFRRLTEPSSKSAVVDDDDDDDKPSEEREVQAEGSVDFKVYKGYFKAVGSNLIVAIVLFLRVVCQAAASGIDYFVAQWVNWEEEAAVRAENATLMSMNSSYSLDFDNSTNLNSTTVMDELAKERMQYVTFYAIIMASFVVIIFKSEFSFFYMCMRASQNLHDKLFRGVTGTYMSFFNNNPSGRVLNRFSKDIGSIDTSLPNCLFDCTVFVLELAAVMALVAIVNYWFLLPTALMTILLYVLRYIYINTSRSIKRLEAMTRSPYLSHVQATLQGLSTIRAFKAENAVIEEFTNHLNFNSATYFIFLTISRAFAFWLDIVCVVYITIVTLSFVDLGGEKVPGGNVGLAITQVMGLIGMCQWGMRQTADLENQMISVERVLEYSDLPAESKCGPEVKLIPDKKWPADGNIEFNKVELKYSETGAVILKDLNFAIKSNEKIGVVGRTAAGKSSLVQALFRLAPTTGSIIIDDIKTNDMELKDLRSKMSIIPQDPILFSGTLRSNLDPFDEKSDEELWNVIEEVELKEAVHQLSGGLECKMSDGGTNFSLGQRQLICLARALLRRNKILILDEATANVDPETDQLIQETIRQKFANCTVLTIAHRLHTVMDSDRVLVMDAGKMVEFDHPHELLKNETGHLRQLVDQTGPSTANYLMDIAQDNFSKKDQ